MNKRIKLINKISNKATSMLSATYEVGGDVENPDGIIVRSDSLHDIDFNENLKAIARAGAGVNNIPIMKCSEKGIVVFNTPGANANAVKELTVLALLLASRKVVAGIEWTKNLHKDLDVPREVESGKSQFLGPELQGKVLGVVGLGAIGHQVANLAVYLGMRVLGYDPYVSDDYKNTNGSVEIVGSLDDLYRQSDYISLHVPFNSETKRMINFQSINQMKDGVRIINFSRADLVDNEAIIECDKVACYVTDFPTNDLIGIDKVIAIPHLGASTPESEDNCAMMAAQEISEFLEEGNIYNSVNYPTVILGYMRGNRIGIFYKDVDSSAMIRITDVFAHRGIVITNLNNNSKKDNGYALIQIDADIDDQLIDELNSIPHVVRVLKFSSTRE